MPATNPTPHQQPSAPDTQTRAEILREIERKYAIRDLVSRGVKAELERIVNERGLPALDWIVCRGESGPEITGIVERPEPEVRGIVEQYAAMFNAAGFADEWPIEVREGCVYVDGRVTR